MSLELITLLLVRVPTPHVSMLREATRLAFPGHDFRLQAVQSLEDARVETGDHGIEILVLRDATSSELARALAATNADGLPRWGIVSFGDEPDRPGVEVLAAAEAHPRFIARALRSSHSQLQLRREVERERGDVWTLGRRLTHDLRNPLGCIVTTAGMMREMLAAESPNPLSCVDAIMEGTSEMLELINRIHFMAKVSAQPKAPELVGMDGVRQAAIDRLQREITRRGVSVSGPESWPDVLGVRPWLEVVWGNLLANALRHGGERPRIETAWRREATEWRFEVTDDGPGVAPERMRHLFMPFHRLHQSHGCGLGLSMVHRLVHLHGGRCGYEGGSGRGATFYFTLPGAGRSPSSDAGDASTVATVPPQFADESARCATHTG